MDNHLLEWLFSKDQISQLPVRCQRTPSGGRGLVLIRDIDSQTPLFTIPARFLLNRFTIGHQYPLSDNQLTSTQLLSLHLYLHRHDREDKFWPFISSLPEDFDAHPLTWVIKTRGSSLYPIHSTLLRLLPGSARRPLNQVEGRFQDDIHAIRSYMKNARIGKWDHPDSGLDINNFLWAWLNVNTRCLYLRIGQTSSMVEDLTLCPLVDFANHTGSPQLSSRFIPNYSAPSLFTPGVPTEPLSITLTSRGAAGPLKIGDEILLEYGSHSNTTLFSEYGFVLPRRSESDAGDIDLDDIIQDMLHPRGLLQGVLERWGYWHNWSIHTQPPPAHPSYRLLTVLRLICLPAAAHASILQDPQSTPSDAHLSWEPFAEDTFDRWKATVLGLADSISDRNEEQTRELLVYICIRLQELSHTTLAQLDEEPILKETGEDWASYGFSCVRELWTEVRDVAFQVHRSVVCGEEF